MFESNPDWDVIIRFFAEKEVSLNALLSGKDFFKMTLDYYNANFRRVAFSDFLWTMRSLYLPLFTILKSRTRKRQICTIPCPADMPVSGGVCRRACTNVPF